MSRGAGGGGGGGIFGGEEIGGGGGGVRRRPFFGTAEDMMMEEEYYDEQLTHEKKRRLTPEQVHALEVSFEVENKLEPERKSELAKKLGLQPRQVAIWFQNRRARWKTKQLERDFDRLKSSYDSLLTDHDSLLADNQRLRSEVVLLMEKLENKKSAVVSRQDSTIVASLDTIESIKVMVDHPSIGSGNSLPAFEEDEGTLHVVNSITSYYPEPEDGVSYNGGGIVSSEEEGSDSGGAYFPGIFTDENVVMEQQQQQLVSEDNAISWWAWE